jgi:hypothetical protein
LFFFDWPLPGFIGLLGVLPVSLLARVIVGFFLAQEPPLKGETRKDGSRSVEEERITPDDLESRFFGVE